MNRTTSTFVMAGVAVIAMATSAAAQTPRAGGALGATFRCPETGACVTADAVKSDGWWEGSTGTLSPTPVAGLYNWYGYDTYTSCTPKNGKCTYKHDGAYINDNGGLDINLVTAGATTPDRTMVFDFNADSRNEQQPPPCGLPSAVSATKVDFRFNSNDIELMPNPFDAGDFAGSINFTPDNQTAVSNVFLRFGTIADGTKSLYRQDATTWILTSNAQVEVVCYATSKGRITTTSAGYYWMPFQLTVIKLAQ